MEMTVGAVPYQLIIAGFTFDPLTAQSISECINKEVTRLIGEQGLHAFEMSKSAAVAHESGHAMVAMHDHVALASVDISRRVVCGIPAWGGYTKFAVKHSDITLIGPNAEPTDKVLQRICTVIAGVVGERVLDPSSYREGSSLDEVVVSQLMADALTQRPELQHLTPKNLWNSCWHRTVAIIMNNEKLARSLMAKLDAQNIVGRKQLEKLTANIRRLENDSIATQEIGART